MREMLERLHDHRRRHRLPARQVVAHPRLKMSIMMQRPDTTMPRSTGSARHGSPYSSTRGSTSRARAFSRLAPELAPSPWRCCGAVKQAWYAQRIFRTILAQDNRAGRWRAATHRMHCDATDASSRRRLRPDHRAFNPASLARLRAGPAQSARVLGEDGKAVFFEPMLEGKLVVALFAAMIVDLAKRDADPDFTVQELNKIKSAGAPYHQSKLVSAGS